MISRAARRATKEVYRLFEIEKARAGSANPWCDGGQGGALHSPGMWKLQRQFRIRPGRIDNYRAWVMNDDTYNNRAPDVAKRLANQPAPTGACRLHPRLVRRIRQGRPAQ